MTNRIGWGIIGAGHIARAFARGLAESDSGILHGIASRSPEGGALFSAEFPTQVYLGYQALIDDPEIQAVYIATPHPQHVEWAMRVIAAGKHVLVEKPLGMNSQEAQIMIREARARGVFLMEAFMYRCHPQTTRIVELVRSGTLGDISLIEASFCYDAGPEHSNPLNRAYAQELGGGAILDVGCYPLSFARLIAGVATGKAFADPLSLKGHGRLGPAGGDLYAAATLEFPGGIIARLDTAVALGKPSSAVIHGSRGRLTVMTPWVPGRFQPRCVMTLEIDGRSEDIIFDSPRYLYAYEVDAVGRALAAGAQEAPEMTWADTLGNLRGLDRWRQEIRLIYRQEQPEHHAHTVSRLPLRRRPRIPMPTGRIAGIDKPISRLVMGFASTESTPDITMLLDEYVELGGNTIDTSHGYGHNGSHERQLGWWLRHRGVRDDVVVIEKGANYPNNTPQGLTEELTVGLELLQLDNVDLYLIHRDNEQVPIDEWMDALEANRRAGRMRRYGVSNFSLPRLQAAAAWARKHGVEGIAVVSNQFSLARMNAPVWTGCLDSGDHATRAWHAETGMPLMPWSSQARGFFTPRAGRNIPPSEEFARCWYSESNFQRKDRVEELARQKDVQPIQIALAWVLHQPFTTFPMVGPLNLVEMESTFASLAVSLTVAEVTWLEDGTKAVTMAGVENSFTSSKRSAM